MTAVAGLAPRQGTTSATTDVETLHRTSCQSCHPAPDTRYATDRAWLEQIRDTA